MDDVVLPMTLLLLGVAVACFYAAYARGRARRLKRARWLAGEER